MSDGQRRDAEFVGRALDELRGFPESARQNAGYQIDRLQQGYARMTGNQSNQSAVVFEKSGYGRMMEPTVSFTPRGSATPCMCCTFPEADGADPDHQS